MVSGHRLGSAALPDRCAVIHGLIAIAVAAVGGFLGLETGQAMVLCLLVYITLDIAIGRKKSRP